MSYRKPWEGQATVDIPINISANLNESYSALTLLTELITAHNQTNAKLNTLITQHNVILANHAKILETLRNNKMLT